MEPNHEALEELKQAIKDGKAVYPMMDKPNLVLSDGDAHVFFADNSELMEGMFGLTVVDGGGFTGIFMTKETWEEMKVKVDQKISEFSAKS